MIRSLRIRYWICYAIPSKYSSSLCSFGYSNLLYFHQVFCTYHHQWAQLSQQNHSRCCSFVSAKIIIKCNNNQRNQLKRRQRCQRFEENWSYLVLTVHLRFESIYSSVFKSISRNLKKPLVMNELQSPQVNRWSNSLNWFLKRKEKSHF